MRMSQEHKIPVLKPRRIWQRWRDPCAPGISKNCGASSSSSSSSSTAGGSGAGAGAAEAPRLDLRRPPRPLALASGAGAPALTRRRRAPGFTSGAASSTGATSSSGTGMSAGGAARRPAPWRFRTVLDRSLAPASLATGPSIAATSAAAAAHPRLAAPTPLRPAGGAFRSVSAGVPTHPGLLPLPLPPADPGDAGAASGGRAVPGGSTGSATLIHKGVGRTEPGFRS